VPGNERHFYNSVIGKMRAVKLLRFIKSRVADPHLFHPDPAF
jgi:hypothetical protein